MAYVAFDESLPDGTTENPTEIGDSSRLNLQAISHAILMNGYFPGWDCEAQNSGGGTPPTTPEAPDQWVCSKGTQRIKLAITYNGSGNVTVVTASYSINSGSSYDAIGTFTLTYDASQNILSGAWS